MGNYTYPSLPGVWQNNDVLTINEVANEASIALPRGTYKFEVLGGNTQAGRGALVTGNYIFSNATTIRARGGLTRSDGYGADGGFVAIGTTPLFVAGGAAWGGGWFNHTEYDASLTTSGKNGQCVFWGIAGAWRNEAAGYGGSGGADSVTRYSQWVGAEYEFGNGMSEQQKAAIGKAGCGFANGARGGASGVLVASPEGGGISTVYYGGGGGGYSGGGNGIGHLEWHENDQGGYSDAMPSSGGGGGSYSVDANGTIVLRALDTAHGFVRITAVSVNTAPSVPASITVPNTINGGTTVPISWAASTDAEGNLAGYKLEKSTDGGSTWAQIYQGATTSTTDTVALGTVSVTYRVKAYDALSLESGYRASGQVTIINNQAPSAPASIDYGTPNAGEPLTVTVGVATDTDGSIQSYTLERQIDSGAWTQIAIQAGRAFADTVPTSGTQLRYRAKAADNKGEDGPYVTGAYKAINYNKPPRVSLSTTNAGEKRDGFSITYTVNDDNAGDILTAIVKADGTEIARMSPAVRGQAYTVSLTTSDWMKAGGGSHEIVVTVDDGKGETATAKCVWTKTVKGIRARTRAFTLGYMPSRFTSTSELSAPAGTTVKWEVCNNALDANPTWEDASSAIAQGQKYHFQNETKTAAFWAGAIRLTTIRGTAGESWLREFRGVFEE